MESAAEQGDAPGRAEEALALDLPGAAPDFEPPREGPVIGIDLGTTNSCVAIVGATGRPEVIVSREGYSTIPSVVALSKQGQLLVGHPAKRQVLTQPERTVYGSKRLVGRPFHSPVVYDVLERSKFEIVEGAEGEAAVRLGGHIISLEEVAALILLEARQLAEAHLGAPVHRAVITCPAFYHDHQRAAVRRAGKLAGLYVERIVNEPTAAALAFGYGKGMRRRIAVFDLGGGTFDVTVLDISKDRYEVLSTGGDTFLGGADFDQVIANHLVLSFVQETGVPFPVDPVAYERVMDAAEAAKCALTAAGEAQVQLPFIAFHEGESHNLDLTLDRPTLEGLCGPLVDRTLAVVESVLALRDLSPLDIDDVLLVGGMTRMPLVEAQVRALFERLPLRGVHADEAIALGAALLAHSIGSDGDRGVELIDVLPRSIGVALSTGRFKKVIARNTRLPAQKAYTIPTTRDNQRSFELHVFQGEHDDAYQNERLGTLRLTHLPKGPKGSVRVRVIFDLSEEGLLTLTARDLSSRREITAVMSARGEPPKPAGASPESPQGIYSGPTSAALNRSGLWRRILSWFGR